MFTAATTHDRPLQPYLDAIGSVPLLGAEGEVAAAERLGQLRVDLWEAALDYLAWAEALAEFLPTVVSDAGEAREELVAYREAAAALRTRETRANQDGWAAARRALAVRMAKLDPGARACERVIADISSAEARQRDAMSLAVKALPPARSATFKRYATRIRSAASTLTTAKNAFVKANLRLVVSMAPRFSAGRIPLADAIQEGNVGLMRAVDMFDPERGTRFSTYAAWWIRHAVTRAVADRGRLVRLPVHMLDMVRRVARTRAQFVKDNQREATPEELSELTGFSVRKITRMHRYLLNEGTRLDAPLPGQEGIRHVDLLEDSGDTADDIIEHDLVEGAMLDLLDELRPMELEILHKRFGFDGRESLTLRELGEEYGLSRERIRQIQEKALGKLREGLAARGLA